MGDHCCSGPGLHAPAPHHHQHHTYTHTHTLEPPNKHPPPRMPPCRHEALRWRHLLVVSAVLSLPLLVLAMGAMLPPFMHAAGEWVSAQAVPGLGCGAVPQLCVERATSLSVCRWTLPPGVSQALLCCDGDPVCVRRWPCAPPHRYRLRHCWRNPCTDMHCTALHHRSSLLRCAAFVHRPHCTGTRVASLVGPCPTHALLAHCCRARLPRFCCVAPTPRRMHDP